MAKTKLKIDARRLRRKGKSIKEIAKKLNVSASGVSKWCKDIALTQTQIEKLIKNSKDGANRGRIKAATQKRKKRLEKISYLLNRGIGEIGTLSERDFFIAGVSLYWAEGFKTEDGNLGFAVGDSLMVKFLFAWMRKFLNCNTGDIRLRLTINQKYQKIERDVMRFWMKETGIPREQFHKTMYIVSKNNKEYESEKTYRGTLRVFLAHSTDELRLVRGWIRGIGMAA